MLYGVFAFHTPELCPLNNEASKKIFLDIQTKLDSNIEKFHAKVVSFYMSVLEHEWIIIFDAENAHELEQLCIEVGISAISTVKIVPINLFSETLKKMKSK
jgi:hypothetical protein